jgi:hypothetical protein
MDLLDLVGGIALRHDDGDAERQQHAQLGLARIVDPGQGQHVDCLAVQPCRLDVGVAGKRIARRQLEVLHAAVVLARRLEADGELGGDVADVGAIALFLARGDPALPLDAPRLGDAAAQPLLVHGMHEGIAVGDGAVGPVVAAAAGDELLALHQAVADLLDRLDVEPRRRGDRRGRELRAANRSDLQHAPLLGCEVLDLLADQDLHSVGNGEADPRDRLGEPPTVVVPERVAAHQIVGQRHDEQRVAVGAPVDELRQLAELCRLECEAALQVGGDVFQPEEAQCHLGARTVEGDGFLDRLHGVAARAGLGRAVGADHHQARALRPARQEGDGVERRAVAPV